jgi:hypothetical protein
LFEDHRIVLCEVGRYFDNDRFLFNFPKNIEDTVGNHHNVGFFVV